MKNLLCIGLAAVLCLGASGVARAADTNELMRSALKSYEKGDFKKAKEQFKAVTEADPGNASAREYLQRSTEKAEALAAAPPPEDAAPADDGGSRSILKERFTLSEEMKRQSAGKGNTVIVDQRASEITVTFFMNRLFFPFSDVLRPDSYETLNNAVTQIRSDPKRRVLLKSVDTVEPGSKEAEARLSDRRNTLLISYVFYASIIPQK